MNIHLSTISFNGGINSELPQRPKRRTSALGQVTEPIDNGDPRTAIITRLNSKVMPTPFEDCFEKMSFEELDEDNMWRDAQYQEDFERVSKYNDELTPHIIFERPFIDQYYSEDDIPLADSVIRRTLGFRHLADVHLDFDTQISEHDIIILDQINYNENVFPRTLKGADFATQEEFSKVAAAYKNIGFASQTILRAAERCHLQGYENGYEGIPNIDLFEFLIENPNSRKLVVRRDHCGREVFDRTCANYYKIFHKYFQDVQTIRTTLDLCKSSYKGVNLVNKRLCEIAILLRQKSAQGIETPKEDYRDLYDETPIRFKKYVDMNTPLTEQDIELIHKLKPNNELDDNMYEVAKTLLADKKMTVEFTLLNLDILGARKNEISQLLSKLNEKTLDKDKSTIMGIKTVLDREFEESVACPTNLKNKSVLFVSAKKLMTKGLETPDIALVLKKLSDINKRTPLKENFVDKFIELLKENNGNSKIVINKTMADILTKLVMTSKDITDVDREIIALLKENKYQDPELLNLVNGMLNRTGDKIEVLTAIKERITVNETSKKQDDEIIEQPKVKPNPVKKSNKPESKIIVNGKLIQTPSDWEELALGNDNIIINDSKGYDNSYISQVISRKNNTKTNIQTPKAVKKSLTQEEANSEIAKIEKILLGSARMLEWNDDAIIRILKTSKGDKQVELIELVNKMLDEWCSSQEILNAVKETSRK